MPQISPLQNNKQPLQDARKPKRNWPQNQPASLEADVFSSLKNWVGASQPHINLGGKAFRNPGKTNKKHKERPNPLGESWRTNKQLIQTPQKLRESPSFQVNQPLVFVDSFVVGTLFFQNPQAATGVFFVAGCGETAPNKAGVPATLQNHRKTQIFWVSIRREEQHPYDT